MKPLISRKEIAQLTGLCTKTIKAKERHLGLNKARADLGGKRVYYNRDAVFRELKSRGVI